MLAAVEALPSGGRCHGGGGAAPPFVVERVDFTREKCPECGHTGPYLTNGREPDELDYAVKCAGEGCTHEWANDAG